jgi:CDP-diacylglycerol--glycerol-3-phosphate 3-phosphatidyltransferase
LQSDLGGLLNELGDVVSDIALYLPFGLIAGVSPAAVIATVLLAVLSEMAGVVAVQIGASRRYDGPMGKSDRAFAFGLLAMLLGLGLEPGAWVNAGLLVIALLTITTILNRSRAALEESDQAG